MPPRKQKTVLQTGVYRIRNLANGKVYYGSTALSFKKRWVLHLSNLRAGTHCNKHLQSSWNNYGEQSFAFEVVERCQQDNCIEREQYYLDTIKPWNGSIGYNVCKLAGSRLGIRHSSEARRKMSDAWKTGGRIPTRTGAVLRQETKDKISRSKMGKTASLESRAKMSKARKGVKKPPEFSETMRAKHWSKGPRASEIATKIGSSQKNKVVTEEAKVNIKVAAIRRESEKRAAKAAAFQESEAAALLLWLEQNPDRENKTLFD